MATDLENLKTRRSAIYTELAAMTTKPTYSKGGQSVDWVGYRRSLLDELAQLNALIASAEGPFETVTRGYT